MKTKSRYLKLISIVFLLGLLASAIFIFLLFKYKQFKPVDNSAAFEKVIAELDYSFKILKYPFPEKQTESKLEKFERVFRAWQDFLENFSEVQPLEFFASQDWPEKMAEIKRYLKKADELLRENREDEARAEIEKVYKIFFKIKEENGFKDMFLENLLFLELSKKVGLAENREKAAIYLEDLKLIFTGIKERSRQEGYRQLMSSLEQAILDIERLLPGPDFKQAQNNLLAGSEKLYWQY